MWSWFCFAKCSLVTQSDTLMALDRLSWKISYFNTCMRPIHEALAILTQKSDLNLWFPVIIKYVLFKSFNSQICQNKNKCPSLISISKTYITLDTKSKQNKSLYEYCCNGHVPENYFHSFFFVLITLAVLWLWNCSNTSNLSCVLFISDISFFFFRNVFSSPGQYNIWVGRRDSSTRNNVWGCHHFK